MALPRMRHRTGAAGVAAAKARNLDAAVVAAVQLVEKGSHQAGAVAPDEMAPGVQAMWSTTKSSVLFHDFHPVHGFRFFWDPIFLGGVEGGQDSSLRLALLEGVQ